MLRRDGQQHSAGISAATIRHHARGVEIGRAFRHEAELAAQQRILRLKPQRCRVPAAQTLIFLTQPGIIAAECRKALDFPDRFLNRIHRLGNRAINRCQRVRKRNAQPLHQQRIRLADQHHPEGHGNHDRQRKPRQCLP